MIEEIAVVVKTENHQVWVESRQSGACAGCKQKASCSTSAIGSVIGKKAVAVDSQIALRAGDEVIVAVDEGLVLKASVLLYLAPLMAMFASTGAVHWLLAGTGPHADLWTAGGALLGLSLSMWLINRLQKLFLMTHCTRPIVLKKL
ncbi:SoxR reducing system RseC family protein [Methylobacter sp. YRD-M1]|uniref:SoxR reducing system RseC family protein n=1 Tax=Methylobacter sp. YRD-M1 TaxID=2911520 RepID=UPI00227AE902|nr:SoxR reducing system RseC family protein [Methylobacter sp. YRD-M1]WAK01254.1 SoxR reducing system RseC family protein [Methylobacter sp. YRD-M1]